MSRVRSTKAGSMQRQPTNVTRLDALPFHFFNQIYRPTLLLDEEQRIVFCNQAALDLIEIKHQQVKEKTIDDLFPQGINIGGSKRKNSATLISFSGTKIPVITEAFRFDNHGQSYGGLVLDPASEDTCVSQLSSVHTFQTLTNTAPVAILQLDEKWNCVYANETWYEYSKMAPGKALGNGWTKTFHRSDVAMVNALLRTGVNPLGEFAGEFKLTTAFGGTVWVNANARCLYNDEGQMNGLVITFSDITDRRDVENKLRDLAEKDQLTGLKNRTFFNDRVEIAINHIRPSDSAAIMFVDLDEFKYVNDTLGHNIGDTILKETADRLTASLPEVDTIARIGGDEFTILISDEVNSESISLIASKLLNAFEMPFIVDGRRIYLTCSIGIALATDEDITPSQLLKRADKALYKAKESGKNQFRLYTSELDKKAAIHILLSQSLKEAGRKDFRVVYQPQVDAESGEIIGAEALCRWSHPETEPIAPDFFIKMLEESGLMHEFFAWLIEDIFSTIQRWHLSSDVSRKLRFSINLSAKQLRDRNLADFIYSRCDANQIDPRSIILEITETALIEDPKLAAQTLKKLRKMGFSVSLDDFGTGYSSLANLRDIPLECVKIDKSFVMGLNKNQEDAKIVSAILMLAKTLNLEVVAEGVEDEQSKEWLISRACHIHQGFYYHKPLEIADFEKLMNI